MAPMLAVTTQCNRMLVEHRSVEMRAGRRGAGPEVADASGEACHLGVVTNIEQVWPARPQAGAG